ncbi:hypothetical protein LCGC14_0791880 [marine sediment metagenome]|uniref:Uncharacterized protein n=1 Tax=marine sediment metagenome TaxID=412755 RepID=A0A0F9SZC1_9ZZZZ|nr:hypothetical protein [archaeon]
MGYGSNEAVKKQEENQKWYTTTCAQCHEKFPVTAEDYAKEKRGDEPNWCPECQKKLFSKRD